MGFQSNIDIAISFSTLKICSIRQQGFIKFRVYLYHLNENGTKNIQTISCHPYSILKHKQPQKQSQKGNMNTHQQQLKKNNIQNQSSQLDSQYYLSKGFKVMFDQECHSILQTCNFRTYVDVQKYPYLNLKCQVELLFCSSSYVQNSGEYKVIGRCSCKIRRLFDMSTYLPIIFDEFQGVIIEGTYNAALMDFHYNKQNYQQKAHLEHSNQFQSSTFYEYLNHASGGFNRQQTRRFYNYYRKLLQNQLFSIQERHFDLLRILNQSNDDFRMIRLNNNEKIHQMIDQLGGYNSSNNDRNIKVNPNFNKTQPREPSKYYYRSPSKKSMHQNSCYEFTQKNYSGISSNSTKSFSQQPRNSFSVHKQLLAQEIVHDYLSIKALIFQKWSNFVDFMHSNMVLIAQYYKSSYNKIVKQRLSGNVFSHQVQSNDWKKSAYEDCALEHLKQTQLQKKKIQKDEQLWKQIFLIENQHFFQINSKSIRIFQEIYPVNLNSFQSTKRFSLRHINTIESQHQRCHSNKTISDHITHSQIQFNQKNNQAPVINQNISPFLNKRVNKNQLNYKSSRQFLQEMSQGSMQSKKDDHFVVLVHGYQASRQDFMVLKNCLEIRFSEIKVFISTCNEGRTQDSIEVLGRRFALQLQKFINNSSPSYNYKLSFIGHSMGGLIVRTALCYLENISKNLYSYISLSTPHLGYLYEPSTHIQAGLWVMKTLQKSNSIEEICMRDQQEHRDTFLYRLSKSGSLNKFINLAFVSSAQDKYIPFQSARVQQNQTIISDKMSISSGQVIYEMINGIIGNIQCSALSRIDIIFNIEQSNFDAMIGRTAHIKYLSDRQFIKTFCIVFDKFFR